MKTKAIFSSFLALTLALSLCIPVLAAGDLDVTKDTHLSRLRNIYNNVTVRSGATLSMENWRPDPPGLEIGKSLAVEPGGKITGGSLIFARGATCTGIELYYAVDGEEKLLAPHTLEELAAWFSNVPDWQPNFLYDLDTGHYVLAQELGSDPFEIPEPGDGGQQSAIDEGIQVLAEGLKSLGLFKGVGTNADGSTNFDLERTPTRTEAVVLLIRLLGKDAESSVYDAAKCPFDDVPDWARSYIAYAYDNDLTKGMSATKFGTDDATVQQFETFVLRAMGYSDEDGADFTWDQPEALAENLGIILAPNDISSFNRGTCVKIMEIALRNAMKDGTRLYQKLVADGVFTETQYQSAFGGNME